jgi:hypothetical protein
MYGKVNAYSISLLESSPGTRLPRLIREGPVWKPAENNGQTIDDEVRVRMVLK